MLSPIVHNQFERLQERFPDATLTELPQAVGLVTIPDITIPAGWSIQKTTVWFLIPNGYPGPCPDCFWADEALKLDNGNLPQNSNVTVIPNTSIKALWFSWHVTNGQEWNPSRDDLRTYIGIILDRFRKPL